MKRPHGKYSWQQPHSSRSSLQPAPQTQQPHFSFPAPITALYHRKDNATILFRSAARPRQHGAVCPRGYIVRHILVVSSEIRHEHRSSAVTVSLSMSDLEKVHTVHVEYNDNRCTTMESSVATLQPLSDVPQIGWYVFSHQSSPAAAPGASARPHQWCRIQSASTSCGFGERGKQTTCGSNRHAACGHGSAHARLGMCG